MNLVGVTIFPIACRFDPDRPHCAGNAAIAIIRYAGTVVADATASPVECAVTLRRLEQAKRALTKVHDIWTHDPQVQRKTVDYMESADKLYSTLERRVVEAQAMAPPPVKKRRPARRARKAGGAA